MSSSKTNCKKRSDILRETLQVAKEMLLSMHSTRVGSHLPQPRLHFDVDFLIDPKIINLCNKLSVSSDTNVSGYVTALEMSCESFQDFSSVRTTASLNKDEAYETGDEMHKTRTFIVLPPGLLDLEQNYPISRFETSDLSSTGILILQSEQTGPAASQIQPNTTVIILQSNQKSPFQFDSSKCSERAKCDAKASSIPAESTKDTNQNQAKRKTSQPQIKPCRIFTIDTLSNSTAVSNRSSKQMGEYLCALTDNMTETEGTPSEIKEETGQENKVEDTTDTANEVKFINTIEAQDLRTNNVFLTVTRLETPAPPPDIKRPEAKRFEMVTLDPQFSSITKSDMLGSMQMTQRPIRGASKSPEKKKAARLHRKFSLATKGLPDMHVSSRRGGGHTTSVNIPPESGNSLGQPSATERKKLKDYWQTKTTEESTHKSRHDPTESIDTKKLRNKSENICQTKNRTEDSISNSKNDAIDETKLKTPRKSPEHLLREISNRKAHRGYSRQNTLKKRKSTTPSIVIPSGSRYYAQLMERANELKERMKASSSTQRSSRQRVSNKNHPVNPNVNRNKGGKEISKTKKSKTRQKENESLRKAWDFLQDNIRTSQKLLEYRADSKKTP